MRKTSLVTGASSGIGEAVAKMLLESGYEVYGIGRDFQKEYGKHFHPIVCNLADSEELKKTLEEIKEAICKQKEPEQEKANGIQGAEQSIKQESGEKVEKNSEQESGGNLGRLHLLVNCAGVGYYGPHEQLSVEKISEMTSVNLTAPMVITQFFLRDLKEVRGTIINISSVTANQGNNTHGCAYGATKAGLSSFSRSLFEEVRKYGVRVAVIHPDLTDTKLYRNADFTCAPEMDCHILAEEVADAVQYVLGARDGLVISEITLKPQKNKILRKNPKK